MLKHIFTGDVPAFQIMTKPNGPVCNLDCTYCYYLEKKKLYPETVSFRMDEHLLESFTRQYIESQHTPLVSFTWHGGEPTLMGIEFFRKAVSFQKKYANGKKIENAIQTNGTQIDDNWCLFFKENHFLVGISVDGPREIHDEHRCYVSGKTSFDDVIRAVRLFQKHQVEFNTLTVVHSGNSCRPLDVYNFLKSAGSAFIQFIPVVERKSHSSGTNELKLVGPQIETAVSVTDWSVNPEEYGTFLITIFDEWVRNDVGKVFVQLFDVTLANWTGQPPGLCVFSETCGNAMSLEHNGDLYSCDHFVYPEHRLGNIHHVPLSALARSEQQYNFGNDKVLRLPSFCLECEYRFACHGECPKHRFSLTPDGEGGLNYLCTAYRMFFSYVHPYMQFMGDELMAKRPPANVIQWARKYKKFDSRN